MHILELPSFFTPYGGEFCLDQAKVLQEHGHIVRILSLVQISLTKSVKEYIMFPYNTFEEQVDNITIIKRYLRGIPKAIHQNQRNWVKGVIELYNYYVAKYGTPDIIHAHCAKWAGYAAMLISKKHNIPFAITEHLSSELFASEFNKSGGVDAWQIPLIKKTYRNENIVIPVSKELVENISPYFGREYNYIVISNTINTDFFSYKKREINKSFNFCCIAHFLPLKGYDILLPAFDKLCESNPNCFLHIAGRNTNSKEFKRLLSNLKNINNIKIHGLLNKESIRELLYNCHALVLASRSEAQSLVLLEAMSTGIPIITTPCIANSQKIGNAYSIVPHDNITALTTAMQQLIDNPKDCSEESQFIHNNYSSKPIAQKLTTLFESILSNPT